MFLVHDVAYIYKYIYLEEIIILVAKLIFDMVQRHSESVMLDCLVVSSSSVVDSRLSLYVMSCLFVNCCTFIIIFIIIIIAVPSRSVHLHLYRLRLLFLLFNLNCSQEWSWQL